MPPMTSPRSDSPPLSREQPGDRQRVLPAGCAGRVLARLARTCSWWTTCTATSRSLRGHGASVALRGRAGARRTGGAFGGTVPVKKLRASSACRAKTCCFVMTRWARPPLEERDRPVEEDGDAVLEAGQRERGGRRATRSRRRSPRRADGRAPRSRGSARSSPSFRGRGSGTAGASCRPRSAARSSPRRGGRTGSRPAPRPAGRRGSSGRRSTKTSGCPGSVQSGSTFTRPARSISAPAASATRRPSGEASTPAAQNFVAASIRRSSRIRRARLDSALVDAGDPRADMDLDSHALGGLALSRSSQRLREGAEDRGPGVEQDDPRRRPDRCDESSGAATGVTARRAGPRLRRRSGRRRRRRRSATGVVRRGRSRIRPSRTRRRSAREARARRRSSSSPARRARTPGARSTTGSRRWRGSSCRTRSRCGVRRVSTVRRRASRSMPTTSPRTTRRVPLVPEDVADRRRDVTLGQDPRRKLVEQRLEQVVVRPVDHRDVDIGAPQAASRRRAHRTRSRRSRRDGGAAVVSLVVMVTASPSRRRRRGSSRRRAPCTGRRP